jgi:hypothetical protein
MESFELIDRYKKGKRDFIGAHLRGADLSGAEISGTCLDPTEAPNGNCDGFSIIDGGQWAIGYRTKNSPHMTNQSPYDVGQLREAPIFSTDDTECHPGLFVCPTIGEAKRWGDTIVRVIFRPWECHRAGNKHRVTWFIVWEDVDLNEM